MSQDGEPPWSNTAGRDDNDDDDDETIDSKHTSGKGRGRGRGGGGRGRGGCGRGRGSKGGGGDGDNEKAVTVLHADADPLQLLYFPEPFGENDPRATVVGGLREFWTRYADKYIDEAEIRQHSRVLLNYRQLCEDLPIQDFGSSLRSEPATVFSCLALSLHQALLDMQVSYHIRKLYVRVLNYDPITPLRQLKSNFVDKFVSLRGNVVRVSSIKPLVTSLKFDCQRCSTKMQRACPDGKFIPPAQCDHCKKGAKDITVDRSSATTVDWQKIKVQEQISSEQIDQGRIPRTIECELFEDLVDSCIPGDVVTVSGIVKARKTDVQKGASGKSLFVLYVEANSTSNLHDAKQKAQQTDTQQQQQTQQSSKLDVMQFSKNELGVITAIAEYPNIFKFIVHSLCPGIFGHEVVKAGLLLALFGGNQKDKDSTNLAIRSDPHVLVVGDPGLGKSQLLRAVTKVAPRGVYVCGNTTSAAGLTVTMVRDGAESALEAGALVLGDQGICCIDEFDKMGAEHNALLEAMEQQSISIAKAGMVCTLSARTTVLAAANPVGGHYNRAKTVPENLKISAPLLSRFDIVFILLDRPDEVRDQLLSEHVIALHSRNGGREVPSTPRQPQSQLDRLDPDNRLSTPREWIEQQPLSERLAQSAAERANHVPLPVASLRKYIAYAKKFCRPKLSEEAKAVLQEFYQGLREQHQSSECIPITTRQLESLIRLAEARAKIELRELVTEADARDVVEVMRESMADLLSDDLGHVDFGRSAGMSRPKQSKAFIQALQRKSSKLGKIVFTAQELKQLTQEMKLGVDNFENFLEGLNQANYLLSKGNRSYQLQSAY